MRASEFLTEYKLSVSKDSDGVAIKATAGGKHLGHAEFFFNDEGQLDPQTVWVDERFYGQGIARDMYDHLKSLGYTIVRSWDQTDAGKGFWDKHRGEDATVWEAEQTPAEKFIADIYDEYPQTFQNNHVMPFGSEEFAMFELKPSTSKRGAVEVYWFQAYPLRSGVGSRAMQVLQDRARKHGVALTLVPWDKGQVSQAALTKFYKRQGFKPIMKGGRSMSWEPLDEISRDRLERYLDRAGHQVDTRLERIARARARLNTSYEIYHADKPTKIVDRFEADTPADARQYYQDYIENYQSDVDYDLRLRHATGIDDQLDEGLRDWVAALALTGAMALGTPADAKQAPVAPTQSVEQVSQVLAKPAAQVLKKVAIKSGIVGTELAQFMAQCAHETANFSTMKEHGGSLDFKKYDIKHNPRKARALGNVKPGDGARYHGRGYIQLTGRDNYKRAGQALGLPLEQQPELVERPEVAAKVAVWFWQNRVAPKVASFHDTKQVTKPINPGMRGIADRQAKFNAIKQGAMATPQTLAPRGRKT